MNHAPTCPRRCNFWGDTGVNRIKTPNYFTAHAPMGYPAGYIWGSTGWVRCEGLATASPMGKYICDDAGRARATPPIPICVCNPPIFFIFFGYYRDYCCLSRAYTICNTLGLPFRHKNTPLSNPKGGSVNNYIYNRAGYSLSIQAKNGFVNAFFLIFSNFFT